MNKMQFRWDSLLLPILSIVLGLYLILKPWSATEMLCALVGWMILLAGLVGLLHSLVFERTTLVTAPNLPISVAGIVVGIFFITRPYTLVEIVGLIICIFLMIEGMMNVQTAVQRRRWGDSFWWLPLVIGLLCVALGLSTLFAPWSSTSMMMRLVGVMLLCSGALGVVACLFWKHQD